MVAAGALMLTGAAWALIHCPVGFLRNVLGYASVWGGWGISYWLRQTGMRDFNPVLYADPSLAQSWITFALKIITLAGICFLGWRRRKLSQIEFFTTLGAAFSWIFVFMPGAGVQYMVWWAPFILLLSPRWWIALTAGATVYLARFYYSTADFHFPWVYTTVRTSVDFYWGPSTNLVWGTFIALLLCRSASWFLVEKRAPGASPVSRKPSSGQLRPGARAMRRRCFCGKAES
jgi:hypothetical protein